MNYCHQGGVQNNHILYLDNGETDDCNALPEIKNSSYYDVDNFNTLVNNSVNRFASGIFSINIQSIRVKFQELEAALTSVLS